MTRGHEADSTERLFTSYAGSILILLTVGYIFLNIGRYVLPVLLPEIRVDLDLTRTEAGFAITVLSGVYGLANYPGGRLSDTWSRKTLVIPSLVFVGVGFLLLGFATEFAMLLAGCAVFGIGLGLYSTPSRALISDLYVKRRGTSLGIFTVGFDLGGALASGIGIVIVAVAIWRAAFIPLALLVFAVAIVLVFLIREPFIVERTDLGILPTIRRLVATREQVVTLFAFTLFFFMTNGVLAFLPAYLRESKSFSMEVASGIFALLFVLGILIKPVVGGLSDRFPRRQVATMGLVISAIALFVLLVVGSLAGVLFAIFLFSIGYKGLFPVIDAILLDAAPAENMGGDLGAARTLFQGVGSLGAVFVGFVADVSNYTVAFGFLSVCLLVSAIIFYVQGRYGS